MKALLLNGSPREGNTYAALAALKKGFANIENLTIKEIAANDVSVSPCLACEVCRDSGECVFDDDTNDIMDAVVGADVIVFATPVYWWGITAQLKLIIDKFYSRSSQLMECKKQVGIIVVGQMPVDDTQYEIIRKQFQCISDYLGWDIAFCNAYSAYDARDLENNADAINEIEGLWKEIK